MLCALVVFAISFLSRMEESAEHRSVASCNTRRLLTGIMADRLWIRVSAIWRGGVSGALAVAAVVAWLAVGARRVCRKAFAVSNGRIEATEVEDSQAKCRRIDTILVKEGQFVREGEVLAKMDTRVLQEQRLEAIAQIKEAQSAVAAAQALLEQRQSETRAAQSLVNQRQAELDSVAKRHTRSRSLAQRGAISAQQLDDDRAAAESAPSCAGIGKSSGFCF